MKCKSTYCECDDAARAACDGRLTHAEIRALYADPVPPAGGDVEFPAYRDLESHPVADIEYQRDVGYNQALAETRPIVTRLQAEAAEEKRLRACAQGSNAAWGMTVSLAETLLDDPSYELSGLDWDYEHTIHGKIKILQAELTKARELLAEARYNECLSCAADAEAMGADVVAEYLRNWAERKRPTSSQSAPAYKE